MQLKDNNELYHLLKEHFDNVYMENHKYKGIYQEEVKIIVDSKINKIAYASIGVNYVSIGYDIRNSKEISGASMPVENDSETIIKELSNICKPKEKETTLFDFM